jgi:glycosyltransferase involved in cell wall biosynthesis
MIVLYFGTYSKGQGYSRNRVLIKGLKENRVEVKECHIDLWKGRLDKLKGIRELKYALSLIPRFIFAYLQLVLRFFRVGSYDLIIVGYAGHIDVFLAKILNFLRHKPLVFDAFLSLYDTTVNEFKVAGEGSWKAKIIWLLDRYSCLIADAVLLDTEAHIKYFVEEFKLPYKKFIAVCVGQDDELFKPSEFRKENNDFNVLFFANFTALHGTEYIIQAAKILEPYKDIHFTLIGNSPLYDKIYNLAKELSLANTTFIRDFLPYEALRQYIGSADVCLGIFGTTEKAKKVVPCKIYDCLAMAKPVITADSKAVGEILTDRENIILCQAGNAESIARAIILLRDNPALRQKVANQGYQLFCQKFTPKHITEGLIAALRENNLYFVA